MTPLVTSIFCALTQAPETFRSVLLARSTPLLIACSKLVAERPGRILFPDVAAKPGNEWFYLTETVDAI